MVVRPSSSMSNLVEDLMENARYRTHAVECFRWLILMRRVNLGRVRWGNDAL
jgi:hypothetical protein